jgi:cytochrome c-type biogenesis protein CcmE
VARKRSPARLIIAVSVAAVLAVFLLYTSLAGGSTLQLRPSTLAGHDGKVSIAGVVLRPITGDPHGAGMHFRLRDKNGTASVPVVYTGTVPDAFKVGGDVVVDGHYANGVFTAVPGTLITKCPSKYTPKKTS